MFERIQRNKNENSKKKLNISSYISIIEKEKIITKKNYYNIFNHEQGLQKLSLNLKKFLKLNQFKNLNDFIINKINIIKKEISFISRKKLNPTWFFLIFIILIMLNLQFIVSKKIRNNIYLNSSNITIRIHGSGIQHIFSQDYSISPPNIIYINGIKTKPIKYYYDFKETDNIVKLVWNTRINNCNYLFQKCQNITNIDLSNFDFSLGISAKQMFWGCISLKKIIFPSSGKVIMKDLGGIFSGCISLTSLDLSNFDTSSVTDFGNTFKNCSSLTSLNLTRFFQSSSTKKKLYGMFSYCENLMYLNLEFCLIEPISSQKLFLEGTRNLVICSNSEFIKSIVRDNNCINIDCSEN